MQVAMLLAVSALTAAGCGSSGAGAASGAEAPAPAAIAAVRPSDDGPPPAEEACPPTSVGSPAIFVERTRDRDCGPGLICLSDLHDDGHHFVQRIFPDGTVVAVAGSDRDVEASRPRATSPRAFRYLRSTSEGTQLVSVDCRGALRSVAREPEGTPYDDERALSADGVLEATWVESAGAFVVAQVRDAVAGVHVASVPLSNGSAAVSTFVAADGSAFAVCFRKAGAGGHRYERFVVGERQSTGCDLPTRCGAVSADLRRVVAFDYRQEGAVLCDTSEARLTAVTGKILAAGFEPDTGDLLYVVDAGAPTVIRHRDGERIAVLPEPPMTMELAPEGGQILFGPELPPLHDARPSHAYLVMVDSGRVVTFDLPPRTVAVRWAPPPS